MRATIPCSLFVSIALLAPFASSCGGAMATTRREPTRDAAREMDEQSARLHEAEDALRAAGAECEGRCMAGGSICDAARRICELAAELGDERSGTRCESARASCSRANEATSECSCEGRVTPASDRVKGDQGQGFAASCASTEG